jgi:hypothetical protein
MEQQAFEKFAKMFIARCEQHNAEIDEDSKPVLHRFDAKNNMYFLHFNYVQEWFFHVVAEFEEWLKTNGGRDPIMCSNLYVEGNDVVFEFY